MAFSPISIEKCINPNPKPNICAPSHLKLPLHIDGTIHDPLALPKDREHQFFHYHHDPNSWITSPNALHRHDDSADDSMDYCCEPCFLQLLANAQNEFTNKKRFNWFFFQSWNFPFLLCVRFLFTSQNWIKKKLCKFSTIWQQCLFEPLTTVHQLLFVLDSSTFRSCYLFSRNGKHILQNN